MHILKPFLGKMKNVNTKHVLEQSYETFPAKRNYGCRNQPTLVCMVFYSALNFGIETVVDLSNVPSLIKSNVHCPWRAPIPP